MNTPTHPTVPFFKMHGSGNDFVLIDNRTLALPQAQMAEWARRICRTAFGVGADGLIFLRQAPAGTPADYAWDFYNADGSRAAMCGNGSRCAARLAYELGMAGREHVLGTDAGPIRARVNPQAGTVRVQLTPPRSLALHTTLDVDGQEHRVHFVDTGVPHAVLFPEGLAALDVRTLGRALRTHPHFAPAGTNVNFARVDGPGALTLRTYERGVENETYACGTGAAATALVAHALGLTGPEVRVTTSGGEVLQIGLENGTVFLEGPAITTYRGEMFLDALGLTLP